MPTVKVNTYPLGKAVRCRGEFTNLAGDYYDPSVVVFKLREPDGTITEYTYGTDPEVLRDSLGIFDVWVQTTKSGEHCYRYETAGTNKVADEKQFEVDESCFEVA